MIEIQGILISDSLFTEQFVCNLSACKGACCWEGDYGAPVTKQEIREIQSDTAKLNSYLSEEGKKIISEDGGFTYYEEVGKWGTNLLEDGSCVYLIKDALGIAKCSLEQARKDGVITANKPISCHLYPLRVTDNGPMGFEAWNYDIWDICSAACSLGKSLKMPVFRFLKDSIIRYKGPDFYEEMEAAYKYIIEQNPT